MKAKTSKRLVLVRHAQADNALPGESDFTRLLTRRGTHDAAEMGRRLEEHEIIPQLILSSEARRAHSTAIVIANALHLSEEALRQDGRIYTASVNELLVVVQQQTETDTLMLVGHNPTITEFADKLSGERNIDAMPTCGVVTMHFNVTTWAAVNWRLGADVTLDYPDKIN